MKAPRHDLLLADGHSRTAARWGLIALGAAALTGIITGSGRRTLATLIAAAPAASALAAVLPLNAATAAAARSGILTKGAQAIAAAAKVDTVLFDKTGTLTTGSPSVVAVMPAGRGWSAQRVLQLAAAAEGGAVHPTALAIRKAAHQHGLRIPPARDNRELIGQGAVASVAEHRVAIGSEAFIRSQSTLSDWARQTGRRLHDGGHSVAYVACDGDIIGVIGVADPIRHGAPTVLRLLHGSGVRGIGILTGDHEAAARPVASQLGLTGCWASACPEAKAELIARLQAAGRTVALVGDGLNDAPGLAAADLGVLLGRSHASVTLGAADAIIVGDDLSKVAELIRLGRRAARATRQNQWHDRPRRRQPLA